MTNNVCNIINWSGTQREEWTSAVPWGGCKEWRRIRWLLLAWLRAAALPLQRCYFCSHDCASQPASGCLHSMQTCHRRLRIPVACHLCLPTRKSQMSIPLGNVSTSADIIVTWLCFAKSILHEIRLQYRVSCGDRQIVHSIAVASSMLYWCALA